VAVEQLAQLEPTILVVAVVVAQLSQVQVARVDQAL